MFANLHRLQCHRHRHGNGSVCTCSTVCMGPPVGEKVKPLAVADRSRQICLSPGSCAKSQMLLNALAGSYTDPYRSVSAGNHSTQMSDIRKNLLTIGVLLLYVFHYWKRELTSSDAMQYQQKTCLHLLHIIWAQPSFRSIGKWQTGQRLIGASTAASNGILYTNVLLILET